MSRSSTIPRVSSFLSFFFFYFWLLVYNFDKHLLKTFLLRVISLLRFDFETGEKIKKNGERRGEGMKETKHKIVRRCMYSSKDGKRHEYDRWPARWLWEIHWIVELHRQEEEEGEGEEYVSSHLSSLSLSLFFSLLFCTCVMGATTWNQHNGGWDFTDSATVFLFFFSDKRGIKNTHIATWTDGWMNGKLDLPVPASSTPATSKEDYTHIRGAFD